MQKRNGMMDPDDFRACLISMGYDLVRKHAHCQEEFTPTLKLMRKDQSFTSIL